MASQSSGRVHSPLPAAARGPLEDLRETLRQLNQQVKEVPSEHTSGQADPPHPPLPAFQQSTHLLSDACTRLSVLFSSPPPPTSVDCAAVTSKVEQTATHLLACLYHFSPAYGTPQMMWTQHLQGEGGRGRDGWREGGGKVLQREIQRCAQSILQATERLVSTIITAGSSTVDRGLRETGSVWECCDSSAKLPRDNKTAVVKELLSQLQLLRDGCREAEEVEAERGRGEEWGEGEMDEGGVDEICEGVRGVQVSGEGGCDGPREWTEREKKLAEPCIHLVKLCSEVASEVCRVVVSDGGCEAEGQVQELDATAAAVQELSPLVDELVGELPAPLQWAECREAGERLAAAITQLLHTVSLFHFCQAAGDKWSSVGERYSGSVSSLTTCITTEP